MARKKAPMIGDPQSTQMLDMLAQVIKIIHPGLLLVMIREINSRMRASTLR